MSEMCSSSVKYDIRVIISMIKVKQVTVLGTTASLGFLDTEYLQV